MRAPVVRMEAVEAIHVPEGRRALREEALPALMESIGRLGIQVPIAIRVVDEYVIAGTGEVCNVPLLVAGRHRLEAARRLGLDSVPVVEFRDEADARLWEISENLHRAELSAVERAEHIEEWRRLTLAKGVADGNPLGGAQPMDKGIAKTAKALGVSEDTVRRAGKIAALPPEVRDQARAEDWSRDRLLREAKPVPPPPPVRNDAEAEDTWMSGMLRLWNKAPKQWRERFLGEVAT